MRELPTGTVTFLFTDIESSTQRWEDHPEAMPGALARHDALLQEAVESNAGYVFKTIGDSVCAVFRTAGEALAASLEAQRALISEDWAAYGTGFALLKVRMGMHTGAADERGGDYFGPPLNRCARLQAAGHGGQVLVSLATQQLLRDKLGDGLSLRDLGVHRLKDLTHSEHVYQLVAPDLTDVTTPLVTMERLHVGDRIVLDHAAAPRSLPEAIEALRAVVLDEETDARLAPEQIRQIVEHRPSDLDAYRLSRIAEWSQPRYRLDGRFVGLSLLIDQGEDAVQGRWQAAEERYDDLGHVLAATSVPAVAVLGPPGCGKSTLLRRLELDTAIACLRGEEDTAHRATFFVTLSTYKPAEPGQPVPSPGRWLAERWSSRTPDLPDLDDLLAGGRVTLLLDALNEMPTAGEAEFRERVQSWKDWLVRLASDHPGNRVVFSCRGLDYSQSLSTPDLRVPQVRIEPLTDEKVRDFLTVYSPGRWREIWQALEGSPQLEVLRSPYFLALLVEQAEATGEMPAGRAALFTGFVRQALRRELERASSIFESDTLLARRDRRQVSRWRWKGAYDLPERGLLVPRPLASGPRDAGQARGRGAVPGADRPR